MDRIITKQKQATLSFLNNFQYLDLFPYTLVLLLLAGEIYILNAFIAISRNMN